MFNGSLVRQMTRLRPQGPISEAVVGVDERMRKPQRSSILGASLAVSSLGCIGAGPT
jgi:hypothetical protein